MTLRFKRKYFRTGDANTSCHGILSPPMHRLGRTVIASSEKQSVRVIAFDESEGSLPEYRPRTDLVVFPSEHSVCWTDMSPDELAAVRRVVLVDSRRGYLKQNGRGGRVDFREANIRRNTYMCVCG